jgi:hypothetical protein
VINLRWKGLVEAQEAKLFPRHGMLGIDEVFMVPRTFDEEPGGYTAI